MKKKILTVFIIVLILVAALLIWMLWANKALVTTEVFVSSENIPDELAGFRIAQVSDLHNAEIGKDNEKLISALKNAEPDIIAITGDIISSYAQKDINIALDFVKKAIEIAPCYYISGNHEARIDEFPQFEEEMTELGVNVLNDEKTEIEYNGATLDIIGMKDPSFYAHTDTKASMKYKLETLCDDSFSLVLSHRPEYFDVYCESVKGIVLSGHAHGGQFRLPFIGGLFAPGQGFLPEYDSGLYSKGDTNMYVSRGIGNSAFPLRFNNRPELVIIEFGI